MMFKDDKNKGFIENYNYICCIQFSKWNLVNGKLNKVNKNNYVCQFVERLNIES